MSIGDRPWVPRLSTLPPTSVPANVSVPYTNEGGTRPSFDSFRGRPKEGSVRTPGEVEEGFVRGNKIRWGECSM